MKPVPKVLDAIVDKVLAYRPKPKSKPARKRKRRDAKIAPTKFGDDIVFEKGQGLVYEDFIKGNTFTFEVKEDGRTWRWTGIIPIIDHATGTVTIKLPPEQAMAVT